MESNCSVLVSDNSSGFITGQLSWHHIFEEVEFMLLEIKRGYIVIGEVSRGPRLFGRTCWRMVGEDQRPSEVLKGQRLHFVRPGWVSAQSSADGLEVLHAQQVLPPKAPPEPSEGLEGEEQRHRDSVGPLESSGKRPSVVPKLDFSRFHTAGCLPSHWHTARAQRGPPTSVCRPHSMLDVFSAWAL